MPQLTAVRRRLSEWTPPYAVWVSAAAALFAWLTPNHEPPWQTFVGEYGMAVAAWVLGVWVLWVTRREAGALPFLAGLALLTAIVPWLQLAAGLIPFLGIAVLASLYLIGFALLVVTGYRGVAHWTPERFLGALAQVFLFGALLSMGLAFYGWAQLDHLGFYYTGTLGVERATGNLNQPNQLATLLVMGLLSVAALLDTRRIGRPMALLLVIVFAFGLAMTQSRAGLLEVGLAAALFAAKRKRFQRELRLRDVAVATVIVFAMPMLWTQIASQGGGGTIRGAAELSLSTANRLIHWQEMVSAIRLQPWFGWGWTSTAEAQYAVALDFPATQEILAQSHNLLIEMLVWNGVPIGLLVIGSLFAWFWLAVKRAADSSVLIMLAIVLGVTAHAMVEYPLHYTFFLFPVALLMGGISRITMPDATRRISVAALAGAAVALAVVMAVILADYDTQDDDMREMRMRQSRIGLHLPAHIPREPLLLWQLHSYMDFFRQPVREDMTADELEEKGRVARHYPSGQNYVIWASALAINGRPDEAREVLRRVCKLDVTCELMKARWAYFGQSSPAIARIPWPKD